MRKSQSTSGIRPLRAGIAVAATAAAAVVGLAAPAYAADIAVTLTPTQAPTAGGQVVTFTGSTVLTSIATGVAGARWVASTATCGGTYDIGGGTTGGVATKTDANSGTVVTPALAAGSYKLCLYATNTTGAIAGHSTTFVTVVPSGTVPSPGPTAGGDFTLTATSAFTTATGTLGVTYTAAATTCPDKYTPAAPAIIGTAVRAGNNTATVTAPNTLLVNTSYQVCVYGGTVATTSSLLARGTGAMTVKPAVTISPKNGPSGGNYTMTLSTPTAVITNSTPVALITLTSCPVGYVVGSGVDPWAGGVTKISNSKVAVSVPAGVATTDPTAAYNVCLYNGAAGALLGAPGILTVAPALSFGTISVSVNGAGANPTGGGPAQGGTAVTITGITGLPTQGSIDAGATLTARLGNSPITGLTVTAPTAISGTTSPHAAGDETLTVTTAAGSATTPGTVFTFSYGITSAPNTAATDASVTVDVLGSGFDSLTFSSTAEADASDPPANGVGVFLVSNEWYALADSTNSIIAAGLVAQCVNVTKISDVELICTLNLADSLDSAGLLLAGTEVPQGAYNVAVVNDSDAATLTVDANISRISSASVFTVADY